MGTPDAPARPIRVVQLITTLARGGAQATVLASREMSDLGVDVSILAGTDDSGEGTHWEELRSAVSDMSRLVEVPTLRRRVDPLADLRTVVWLTRWLRANRPDVVHTHSSKAGVLGRLAATAARVPVVHTVHGWSFAAHGHDRSVASSLARTATIWLERALSRLSAALVVVSTNDADEGIANRVGTQELYRVVRSGIDLQLPRSAASQRETIRSELDIACRFAVGTVGRLAPQKDLATLLSGFAQAVEQDDDFARDAMLLIVGDGPQRGELEATAARFGVANRTRFLGRRSDAARLVAAFDVFALTSLWEGLPRTVVEAAAAGVPVIATPVGGVGELIREGETGTLVPVSDPGAVADALVDAYLHRERFRLLAERAELEIDQFSVERMRADLRSLWLELASNQA